MEIAVSTVQALIAEQFPEWASLPITPVKRSGWDNRTFRLGKAFSIRMPSEERYVPQVKKEQQWLSFIANSISTQIPQPVAHGRPNKDYPWEWSIYQWIEGDDIDPSVDTNTIDIALKISQFIRELHKVDAANGPVPGPHNFYRGENLRVYDKDTRTYVKQLADKINADAILALWRQALNTEWASPPVWIHGDLEPSNLLVSDNKLVAVIDFGSCAVGDPACDLVIAWTFFNSESREAFRANLNLSDDTWVRGKAWALWKALFQMSKSLEQHDSEHDRARLIIERILRDRKN